MQKIAVFGLGVTGLACVEYFKRQAVELYVINRDPSPHSLERFYLESQATEIVLQMDLIILSPGISREHRLLQYIAVDKILSDVEYFSRLLQIPVIAITGTNGKTTTTLMTEALLKSSGARVFTGGNIGIPLAKVMEMKDSLDVVLLELSSFQLESTFTFHPKVCAILNISQNHAERYSTIRDYTQAKYRIMQNQTSDDIALLHTSAVEKNFYPKNATPRVFNDEKLLEKVEQINHPKLWLKHNRVNFAFALTMVESFGAKPDIEKALELFKPAKYRMEYIGKLNGADVFNDSKSTNISSLVTALDSIEGDAILILGGKLRGQDDFSTVLNFKSKIKVIYALGEAANLIEEQLSDKLKVIKVEDLSALKDQLTQQQEKTRNIVFAPALPSYDLFKNFEHRGESFEKMIQTMSGFVSSEQ